jgi:hypothetical protein
MLHNFNQYYFYFSVATFYTDECYYILDSFVCTALLFSALLFSETSNPISIHHSEIIIKLIIFFYLFDWCTFGLAHHSKNKLKGLVEVFVIGL